MRRNKHSQAFFQKHNDGRVMGDEDRDYELVKIFHEDKVEASYNKLKAFLETEGFDHLSIPKDTDELYLLSEDDGNEMCVEIPPIIIHQSPYHEEMLVLRINNENRPNYLLDRSSHSDESRLKLKLFRIEQAIEFVEKSEISESQFEHIILPDRLREIAKTLLEVNLDKTTIIGALLQNGYSNELFTFQEVADEFGIDVAEAMHCYAFKVF